MRRRPAPVAALGALLIGCGGGAPSQSPPAPGPGAPAEPADPADPAPGGDSADPGDSGAPPPPLPGLDARPPNPGCAAGPRPVDRSAAVALEPAADGLTFRQPTHLAQVPGSGAWCVSELKAELVCFDPADPAGSRRALLRVPELADTAQTEWGLLGFAFHPAYPADPRVFLYHTARGGASTTLTAVALGADGALDLATATPLLSIPQPADTSRHSGGLPAFHPRDGHLYLGVGDGGTSGAPDAFGGARDPASLLGKVLRIDVDGGATSLPVPGAAYAVPADNPWADGVGGRPEVFAQGFRNPWRMAFDRATGALWVGDVGHACWEEVDRVQRGGDYGWPLREGAHPFDLLAWDRATDADGCDPDPGARPGGLTDPIWEYAQDGESQSVTGGVVYRGAALPELRGHYLFADFRSGKLWALPPDPGPDAAAALLLDSDDKIVSFAEDADGEVWVLAYSAWTGVVRRLRPLPAGPADTGAPDTGAPDPPADPPAWLSQTGCVLEADPTTPAPGLIPYGVAHALWSDGAEKRRWIALPDGATIAVAADGAWELPVGTVLVKEFWAGDRRVETRLLSRHDDGSWSGATYAWDAAQTDAARVDGGAVVSLEGGEPALWEFPSSNACLSCHTAASGRVLGFHVDQLDGPLVYPTGREANQLYTLDHLGLFSPPLGAGPDGLPGHTALSGRDGRGEASARAWLSVNCASCHQPGGDGRGELDLRHTTPWAEVGACDAPPAAGDLGIADARLIAPGAPERSVLLARVQATDATRMPPLGSHVVDAAGVEMLRGWIAGMAGCG